MPSIRELSPQELLGSMNEIENKFAPTVFYACGHLEIMTEGGRVSIVGSRKASNEGLARAKRLAGMLAELGHVVVSGLAEGIDTAAHHGAIERGGKTIAVIGTPLDKFYPKKNTDLQKKIAEDHLLISQFPIGHPTLPQNFPMRNRVMALISDATVIVEASDSSGSLSQGWEALRLGRNLFIAKSILDNLSLTWPEKMLGYGACVLSEDTLDDFLQRLPQRSNINEHGAVPF